MIYLVPFAYAIPSLLFYLLGILNGEQTSFITLLLSLGYYNGLFTYKVFRGR